MPLGIQQNNDFTQFTMDVWNDKIFYQEQEFPAGFMAMSILNIPEEKLPELIQAAAHRPSCFLWWYRAAMRRLRRYSRSCGNGYCI